MTDDEQHMIHNDKVLFQGLRDLEEEAEQTEAQHKHLVGALLQDLAAQRDLAKRRRWGRRILVGGGALTLAVACLCLVVLWPQTPAYTLYVPSDATALDRPPQPDSSPARLSPSSTLRVDLRPSTRVSGDVKVRAYVGSAGTLRYWQELQPTQTGTVRVQVPVSEVPGLGPGSHRLIFLIGRGTQPPPVEAIAAAVDGLPPGSPGRLGGWQVLWRSVEISGGR